MFKNVINNKNLIKKRLFRFIFLRFYKGIKKCSCLDRTQNLICVIKTVFLSKA